MPSPAGRTAVPTPGLVGSLSDVAGEWDIVRFDGYAPPRLDGDGQRHAYVDIYTHGMRFSITCNHSGMAGRIELGVLHRAPVDDGMQTVMGCGAEREARETTFFGFFRAQPRVSLLPDGRLRMATGDHELLLERASVRRLAMGPPLAEIIGSWRIVSFMHFQNGGHRGWGALSTPGRVQITQDSLSYSRCPEAAVRVAYTGDFVLRRADAPGIGPQRGCRGSGAAATDVELMLVELLGQSPPVERVNRDRFILRSRNYAVLLTSQAAYLRDFGR